LELIDFNGKKLWEVESSRLISENSSTVQFSISRKDFESYNLNNVVLSATFKSESTTAKALFYFVKPKELVLSNPTIQLKFIDDFTLEVTSDVLAKNVYLQTSENVFFSDNYFDVLPNQIVIIKLSRPIATVVAKSLFDTMK
jgi:beta-mannosidase